MKVESSTFIHFTQAELRLALMDFVRKQKCGDLFKNAVVVYRDSGSLEVCPADYTVLTHGDDGKGEL